MRIYEQALRQALLQSFLKPDVQQYTENLRRPIELSWQEANVNSLGGWGGPRAAVGMRCCAAHSGQSVSCLAVENMAHCEFPLLRDLLIR